MKECPKCNHFATASLAPHVSAWNTELEIGWHDFSAFGIDHAACICCHSDLSALFKEPGAYIINKLK